MPGDQGLELLVVAKLLGVQHAVAVNDPAHVAGVVGSQQVRDLGLGPGAEQRLDGAHGLDPWELADLLPEIC